MTGQYHQERFERIAEEAFEPLQRYLRRRATPQDAEDVLSEVLLTVWRRIEDAPVENALPWCYGIARRALANHQRGNRRRLRLMTRLGSEPVTHHPEPADVQPDDDMVAALNGLALPDQEVLRLWAWEQLEPREIAQVIGVSTNAATLRLSRAKKRLAQVLIRQDDAAVGHIRGRDPEEHSDD